jgi:hypothetical protein
LLGASAVAQPSVGLEQLPDQETNRPAVGMEYMPCGTSQANAAFFAIGYNLY